jgi:hypothetical protein
MAYSVVPDKASGDIFTETNWDSHILTNLNYAVPRPLGEYVVPVGTTVPDFQFTSIPANHTHLMIVFSGRSDAAAPVFETRIQFNGDTGTNYDYQQTVAWNITVTILEDQGSVGAMIGVHPGASAVASGWGQTVAIIAYYTGTPHKQITSFSHAHAANATSGTDTRLVCGSWRSASIINAINIFPFSGGSWIAGTRALLYGLGT